MCVWGGVITLNCRFFMKKSNARPPSATFNHTAIPRTKELKRFEGKEGSEYLLKRHLNKQLKKEGLSRIILFFEIS